MKIRIASLFVVLLALVSAQTAHAQRGAVATNQLYVNGQRTGGEVAPRILGNTVYVPLRLVTDYLGGGATWNQATQTANLQVNTRNMVLTVGSLRALVNGEGRALRSPIRLQDGRILLPLRDVGNLMGGQTSYNQSSGAVFLTLPEGSFTPANRTERAAGSPTRRGSVPANVNPNGGPATGSPP